MAQKLKNKGKLKTKTE